MSFLFGSLKGFQKVWGPHAGTGRLGAIKLVGKIMMTPGNYPFVAGIIVSALTLTTFVHYETEEQKAQSAYWNLHALKEEQKLKTGSYGH